MTATMTPEETVQHILTEHQMGAEGAQVETTPSLSDIWAEIQADPIAWHANDHAAYGPGHDSGWK